MTRYWFNTLIFISVVYSNGYVNIASGKVTFTHALLQLDQDTINAIDPVSPEPDSTLTTCWVDTQLSNIEVVRGQLHKALVSITDDFSIRGPPFLHS